MHRRTGLPRRESGVSLASGIYEEILENPDEAIISKEAINHVYENPIDVILREKSAKLFTPPPLPPRLKQFEDR